MTVERVDGLSNLWIPDLTVLNQDSMKKMSMEVSKKAAARKWSSGQVI